MGRGKAVDSGDPVQMPRGYGGTAVLKKTQIDHLTTALSDSGSRIHCVEVKGKRPLLVLSVFMPCKGIEDNTVEYTEVVDQLSEILT